MTEVVKQNLEYTNSLLADKMDSSMDAKDLKMLSDGVTDTAKAICEIEDREERRAKDLEEDEKAKLRESIRSWVDIGTEVGSGVIRGLALVIIVVFGMEQKDKEETSYVTTPKTNNLIIDGLKSLIRH